MFELVGKTVLATRPREQAGELRALLERRGATVLLQPAIEILPPDDDFAAVDDAVRGVRAGAFDRVLFSSSNGVRYFLKRFDARAPLRGGVSGAFRDSGTLVAAVGPGTADAAREFGVEVDLIPEEFNAEGLVAALERAEPELAGKRFLSVRADRGRDVLRQELGRRGADVREVVAYRSVDVETPNPEIVAALESGAIDFATVASSATAKAAAKLFGAGIAKTRWIALSPAVAKTLEALGAPVAGVAREATTESLVDATVDAVS